MRLHRAFTAGSNVQDPADRSKVGRVLLYGPAVFMLMVAVTLQAASSRRVTLRAEDGAILSGSYYEPSRRPAPGIVLLHMHRRSHADWEAAADQLADAGFAVLALDFRNADEFASLSPDVRAAKAFLRERPEVMPTRLGIAGASIGANLALIDAAEDAGVVSVALLSPGIDYRGLRTEAAMKKYGGRPALLVGSTKDPYARRSIRILTAIGGGTREVRLTDTVAHGTALLARDQDLIGALVDWFRRTL
jgi:dienelactone hydrolase